jgi:hypothetical protein
MLDSFLLEDEVVELLVVVDSSSSTFICTYSLFHLLSSAKILYLPDLENLINLDIVILQ